MKTINYLIISSILLFSCSSEKSDSGGGESGLGGSMARFAISGNALFTVSTDTMKIFNIEDAANPKHYPDRDIYLGFDIETVFPMDTLLFIGSRSGMLMYDIRDPRFPTKLSSVSHIRSCDPVVAYENYAYVTLNTNFSSCGASPNNILEIYNVSNPFQPVRERTIQLTGPTGLGIDGQSKRLFVCDRGLKVFDITDPVMIRQIDDLAEIDEVNVREAYDVIPVKELSLLILVAKEGLFQFDYSGERLKFLSKIEIKK